MTAVISPDRTPTTLLAAILRSARARVETGWCQGAGARDAAGKACDDRDPGARSWDAVSAIWGDDAGECIDRRRAIYVFLRANDIALGAHIAWNDRQGMPRRDVLAAFDRAIASVEGKS